MADHVDDDSGLPEESQNRLEQENAVPVEAVGPYFKTDVASNRQIFENIDDLYEYGTDIIYGRGSAARNATTLFIVVDNSDEVDLLFPNQPHYWIAERLGVSEYVGDDENFRGDVFFTPFYKKMVEWAEEGRSGLSPPQNAIIAGTYRNVSVYLPDPTLDYSRPNSQTGDTTGVNTGTTVRTTTTINPHVGAVTQSETIPADVGLDAFGGAGRDINNVNVGDRLTPAEVLQAAGGGRGNGAAEVAQRRSDAQASRLTTANVTTGTEPCLPQNAGNGSGSTPPTNVSYDDAILRQSRAAAAAPASTTPSTGGGRGNGAAEVAQRRADAVVTPTTVTQSTSAQSTVSSSSPAPRPPSVYIYEPLTIGFDRYDFNTGKKVYTPDSGPSRNSSSQPMTPSPGPSSVSTTTAAIDGGIPVGTTAGGPSLLRQRREAAALSGGAG